MHFFVKPGAQGLLPILCHTSERWNQIQRDTPEQTEESLKLVLLKALLLELGQRLKNFLGNEESQKAARDMGGKPGPRILSLQRPSSSANSSIQKPYSLSITEGTYQGASDGMGSAGPWPSQIF